MTGAQIKEGPMGTGVVMEISSAEKLGPMKEVQMSTSFSTDRSNIIPEQESLGSVSKSNKNRVI